MSITRTPHTNLDHKVASIAAFSECNALLDKLSKTCCQEKRSHSMVSISEQLQQALHALSQVAIPDTQVINQCIEHVEHCGSQIGRLHVSCCTDKREPIYQALLKCLNTVYIHLNHLQGYRH